MGRDCVVRSGDALNLDDTDAKSEQFLTKCLTEPGARLRLTLPAEIKMPEPTPEHHEPAPEAHDAVPAAPPEAPEAPAPVPHETAPAPAELHATTQAAPEPANAVPDLSQIQGLANGNPVVTVILALILVGGGTAGWKFWQKKSEQSHELAMKKADLELEMAGLNGAQPPPCQAATVKLNGELKRLQEQIDALDERIGKVEKKSAAMFSGGFDPEEMEERVAKIEKELKAAKAADAKEAKAKKTEAKSKTKA